MAATRPVGTLREQARQVIVEKLQKLTVAEVARALRVSRQAIYGFRSGDYCPSMAVIQRACSAWTLEFNINGMIVSERSFGKQPAEQPNAPAVQLTMFDLWEQLQNQKMTVVRAERVDGAVEMTLRIPIPA
jgi:DNA-binding XRE family transcriptional regulator